MKGTIYKIVGFVLLGLGIFSTFYWGAKSGHTSLSFLLINSLPGGLWLMMPWIVSNITEKHSKVTWCVGGIAFILALGLALFVNCFVFGLMMATSPVTKVSCYSKVMERLHSEFDQREPGWIVHIPPKIPENATDVSLYYRPGFLRAGTTFLVRYTLPKAEIQKVLDRYLPLAKEVISLPIKGEQKSETMNYLYFRNKENTDSIPVNKLGEFQMLILYGPCTDEYPSIAGGIAISLKSQEVIYWLQDWDD